MTDSPGCTFRRLAAFYGYGFISGLIVAAAICAWLNFKPSIPSVLAPVAPELEGQPTKTRPANAVVHFDDKAKKKLGLPETVKRDKDRQVTASTRIPADDHPATVTSVFDFGTGSTELYVRRDPLPWFGLDTRKEIGIAYGFKDDHDGAVARIYGKFDIIQAKALRAGLIGSIDGDGDWFAGAGVSIRW